LKLVHQIWLSYLSYRLKLVFITYLFFFVYFFIVYFFIVLNDWVNLLLILWKNILVFHVQLKIILIVKYHLLINIHHLIIKKAIIIFGITLIILLEIRVIIIIFILAINFNRIIFININWKIIKAISLHQRQKTNWYFLFFIFWLNYFIG